ncbi:DUF1659 domain-containing protein [Lapidilactobacillus bayanensis]|uniref:DUF1659 domain-containing protein n=1 Tax=Lapidilactobacillus bayanensis TaxID=2485998 RepID=UPI000F798C04|nr:hypothetical protein [Lapidilactobacillus bayanensis]
MDSVWESTKLGVVLAGDHYEDGMKQRNFNTVVENPTAEQLQKFSNAIAKLGVADTALGAQLITTKSVTF